MSYYGVTKKEFTERVMQREDNYYYKYEMIREIINMYNDELRKALMNGESVIISGIGTIVPTVRHRETNFIPPSHPESDYETLPFVDIHFNKNAKLRDAINGRLRRNLLKNGKLELSENKPILSNIMKIWEENYNKTHK